MDNLSRHIENYLLRILDFFPVIGILGARQVGKTTLVKSMIHKIKKPTLYIDLESESDRIKLTDAELYFESNKEACIIIDEVQHNKSLFPLLRSVVDKYKVPGRFILLGSASPELIRDSSESLAGRIAYAELNPFNLFEINFVPYKLHWLRGGFPLSYLAPDDFFSAEWRENFIRTYIERDIPILGLEIRNINFRKFLNLLAHLNAQTLNYSNLSKSMELTAPTINKYIDFLEKAFLLKKLYPYTQNVKKRLVKAPKLYFTDTGILHQLLAIANTDQLMSSLYQGASWEAYVIMQIRFLLKKEYNNYYYRTHNGAEIDLIIERAGNICMAIEIKYTNAPKLSKGNFIAFEDINADKNYVITPSSDTFLLAKHIQVISLNNFLKLLIGLEFTNVYQSTDTSNS
ncbi:MAG: ATP-binding protein [Chlorobi bacterium]|nr:ATP-binding protein [Chlorobiota bacterium]